MIYLDNAATTEMHPRIKRLAQVFDGMYGNAGTLYWEGERARQVIEDARERIARHIGIEKEQARNCVFFTSGATEGNNWCIKGAVEAWANKKSEEWRVKSEEGGLRRTSKPKIITDLGEHHSVLNVVKALVERGMCTADILSLDPKTGEVDADRILGALTEDTVLVSVMMVNNETGAKNPVEEIGEGIWKFNQEHGCHVLFHVDATQAVGKMEVYMPKIHCHMLTASGHKFHAGKGCGFVYIDPYADVENLMEGGGQQMGRRPGTEDTTGAGCLAEALDIQWDTCKTGSIGFMTTKALVLLAQIDGAHFNGVTSPRSGIVSVWFDGVESEAMLALLEKRGVLCSAGSACMTGESEPSHVLTAMNAEEGALYGTIRISIGSMNTMEEIEDAMQEVEKCVRFLRDEG